LLFVVGELLAKSRDRCLGELCAVVCLDQLFETERYQDTQSNDADVDEKVFE